MLFVAFSATVLHAKRTKMFWEGGGGGGGLGSGGVKDWKFQLISLRYCIFSSRPASIEQSVCKLYFWSYSIMFTSFSSFDLHWTQKNFRMTSTRNDINNMDQHTSYEVHPSLILGVNVVTKFQWPLSFIENNGGGSSKVVHLHSLPLYWTLINLIHHGNCNHHVNQPITYTHTHVCTNTNPQTQHHNQIYFAFSKESKRIKWPLTKVAGDSQ